MSNAVDCNLHGENLETYVCNHLTGESSGVGFNRDEPSSDNKYPDAWCDDCEIIRAAHNGWDDAPEGLCKIVVICSECYERSRIRNTRPSVTLDDLDKFLWKCGTCEEWHTGPTLDFSFDKPVYWPAGIPAGSRWDILPSGRISGANKSFLDEDFCAIDDEHFFVRGTIHLPIIGTAETFRWGVWGSLSRENFETLLTMNRTGERLSISPMFSWLSSEITLYPSTLNLKMHAHIQEPGLRPHFHLERNDHPLSREYHHGILPERIREIMLQTLPPEPPI